MKPQILRRALVAIIASLAFTACSASDPLTKGPSGETSAQSQTDDNDDAIVIGSQDYYSNEIIAEIYAQALEEEGFAVERQFRIGQREVYLPEIEAGAIDLFPEYTGNLLQYWKPDTQARLADEVYTELAAATPQGLIVLEQSEASDQDSYTVSKELADKWDLTSIEDLAKITEPIVLGGNAELETRSYGPTGLKEAYGIEVTFTPIEDGGGPLTVKALTDGKIQLANIFTADPSIEENDLVPLKDTKGLFLASHVVPLANADLDDSAAAVINRISEAMTPEDLLLLNTRSVKEQLPTATIAADWISSQNSTH